MNIRLFAIKKLLRYYKTVGQHTFIHPQLARKAFEGLANFLPGKIKNVSYQSFKIEKIEAEWMTPNGCDKSKVMLFFHGGGFATGSIKTHRALISWIAYYAGIKALAINYRLAPEHKFPTQLDDALTAYQFLLDQGYLPQNIVLAGESAGGNITAATLINLRDRKMPLPNCALLLSPWLDLSTSSESYENNLSIDPMIPYHGLRLWAKNYAGKVSRKNPLASPLFADLHDLPPIYIQVGECEVLVDDSIAFAKKATAAGVEVKLEVWDGLFHAWQGFWMVLPEGVAANKKLGKYLKEKLFTKRVVKKLAKAA